jgi:glycosyltransferase involved in cell wall biosynthesis
MPKVSVIIPVYNRAGFLREAIDSVLNQTWGDFEIIVVDDGSTDGTGEVAKSYGDRIRYFHKKNEGPSKARNHGASRGRGRYLGFLDSDDIWEPHKLDVQMTFLESHPEVELISCGSYALGTPRKRRSPIRGHMCGDLFLDLYQRSFINTSGVVMTRDSFFQAGPFDEAIRTAEDYDLWLKVARTSTMAYLDAPLVGIRKHPDELSKNKLELRQNAIRVIQKHFDPTRVPERIYRRRLADLNIYLGRGYLRIGDFRASRESFRRALRLTPLRFRTIRYFVRSVLNHPIERFRQKGP